MNDEQRRRAITFAEQVGAQSGARFLGSGETKKFGSGKETVQYEPLLVRTSDKGESLKLLTVASQVSSDVALLLDALLAQGRVIAEQASQLEHLRADVEALRAERVTTEVTKQVHEALLQAGRDGVGIEGFDFKVSTAESLLAKADRETRSSTATTGRALKSWSAKAGLGEILDALKSANLAAENANETIDQVQALQDQTTHTERFATKETTGTLHVDRVIPATMR